jgi:hypothetical protein
MSIIFVRFMVCRIRPAPLVETTLDQSNAELVGQCASVCGHGESGKYVERSIRPPPYLRSWPPIPRGNDVLVATRQRLEPERLSFPARSLVPISLCLKIRKLGLPWTYHASFIYWLRRISVPSLSPITEDRFPISTARNQCRSC